MRLTLPTAVLGAILLCLTASGCRSTPPVILQCPPIPNSLTVPCQPLERELVTNADLARAYVESESCRREDGVKLAAIRELAGCRVK